MNIVAKTTEYEFTLDDVKQLFAAELNAKPETLNVRYVIEEVGGDPMDRYPGTNTVTKIKVTMDNTRK